MFEKLTYGVRTVYLEAVACAAELLEQSEIMERGANEDKLHIELLACLSAKLVRPEEDPMRMVKEQRRTELAQQARGFAGHLSVGNAGLYVQKLRGGRWNRLNDLWAAECRRTLYCLCSDGLAHHGGTIPDEVARRKTHFLAA